MRRVDDPVATLVGATGRRSASPSLVEKEQRSERKMISAEQGAAALSKILSSKTPSVLVVYPGDLPTPKAERQMGATAQPRGAISSKMWKCFFPSGGRNYWAWITWASTMTFLNLEGNPSWSSVSLAKSKRTMASISHSTAYSSCALFGNSPRAHPGGRQERP